VCVEKLREVFWGVLAVLYVFGGCADGVLGLGLWLLSYVCILKGVRIHHGQNPSVGQAAGGHGQYPLPTAIGMDNIHHKARFYNPEGRRRNTEYTEHLRFRIPLISFMDFG
jgi:hypothetical protein